MRFGNLVRFIVAAALLAPLSAFSDTGWYIGGALGQARADGLESGKLSVAVVPGSLTTSIDDKDTAGKLFAGYRFGPYFAAEVNYADFGSTRLNSTFTTQRSGTLTEPGEASIDRSVKAFGIDLLAGVTVAESFRLFGRLGWSEAEVESTVSTNLLATIDRGSFFSDMGPELSRTRTSRKGTVKYGAGVEWSPAKSVGLRLEWERLDKVGDAYPAKGVDLRGFPLYHLDQGTGEGAVDMWSVGVVWRF